MICQYLRYKVDALRLIGATPGATPLARVKTARLGFTVGLPFLARVTISQCTGVFQRCPGLNPALSANKSGPAFSDDLPREKRRFDPNSSARSNAGFRLLGTRL